MAILFTSDTHYGHANIIRYCGRPFADVVEMGDALISRWNAVVQPDDTVYHLGDFAFGEAWRVPRILARLSGRIVLVAGNHDRRFADLYYPQVIRGESLFLDIDGLTVECVHNPRHLRGGGDVALCGHVHTSWVWQPPGALIGQTDTRAGTVLTTPTYNVGVDVRTFTPVTLQQVLQSKETP